MYQANIQMGGRLKKTEKVKSSDCGLPEVLTEHFYTQKLVKWTYVLYVQMNIENIHRATTYVLHGYAVSKLQKYKWVLQYTLA